MMLPTNKNLLVWHVTQQSDWWNQHSGCLVVPKWYVEILGEGILKTTNLFTFDAGCLIEELGIFFNYQW